MPVRVEVVDRGSTGESGLISAFERNNEREHRRHDVKDAWRRDKPTKYRFARRCAHKEPRRLSLAATARHAASWCFRDCVVPKSCVVSGGFINAEAPLLKFHFLHLAIPQNHSLPVVNCIRPPHGTYLHVLGEDQQRCHPTRGGMMTAGRIRRRIRGDRGSSPGPKQAKAFLRTTVSNVNLSLNLGPILRRQRASKGTSRASASDTSSHHRRILALVCCFFAFHAPQNHTYSLFRHERSLQVVSGLIIIWQIHQAPTIKAVSRTRHMPSP